jgi:hypothetical protein
MALCSHLEAFKDSVTPEACLPPHPNVPPSAPHTDKKEYREGGRKGPASRIQNEVQPDTHGTQQGGVLSGYAMTIYVQLHIQGVVFLIFSRLCHLKAVHTVVKGFRILLSSFTRPVVALAGTKIIVPRA